MVDSQSAARTLSRFAHFAAAAAVLLAISPAAKAQGLFSFFGGGPSSYEIERRLDASGYTLTGPVVRRGDVYLADVVVARGDSERLVIDAETGRIMQRFRSRPARWRDAAPGAWDQEESDLRGSPPRPPGVIVDRRAPGEAFDLPGAGPEPRPAARDQFARSDEAAKPTVILGPGGAPATSSDLIEKPKPRPSDAKRKTAAPAPAAKATNPAAPEKAAEPAAANPPPSQAVKADAPASVVAAKSPPPAETSDAPAPAPAKSKVVNDLPVTPLD
ncbi:MAG: hypothetical protein ABR878_05060 [Roseiarcus sp.]|jgi:hypothetical protein